MINIFAKKVFGIIKFIDTIGLFVILVIFCMSSFYSSIDDNVFLEIYIFLIFGIFTLYSVALSALQKRLSLFGLTFRIVNFVLLMIHVYMLTFNMEEYLKGWGFLFGFILSLYYFYVLFFLLKDIAKNLSSIEKKCEVKSGEYIGLSLTLILYFFALPILHSRIQQCIVMNENILNQPDVFKSEPGSKYESKHSNPFYFKKD